jgi:methylenetetrahydrofolate reductase (NADPH)
MHIQDIFASDQTTVSFEFFPPKTIEDANELYQTITRLNNLHPSFVSVTYGAGGTTRELTQQLVFRLKETTSFDPIPHLTCVCHAPGEIDALLLAYAHTDVSNLLVLGGDPPLSAAPHDRSKDVFRFAADLVRFVRGSTNRVCILMLEDLESALRDFPKAIRPRRIGSLRWIT